MGALGWSLSSDEVARLDAQSLAYSTLRKSRFRRGFFVLMISLLIFAYNVERRVKGILGWPLQHRTVRSDVDSKRK